MGMCGYVHMCVRNWGGQKHQIFWSCSQQAVMNRGMCVLQKNDSPLHELCMFFMAGWTISPHCQVTVRCLTWFVLSHLTDLS